LKRDISQLAGGEVMDLGIEGRGAAVGGASKGLGLATAQALAAAGARVAICSRDGGRVEEAAKAIGPLATPIVADVSTPAGASAFIEASRAALGRIDILVANGGGPIAGPAEGVELEALRESIDRSLLAMVTMCGAVVPEMKEQGWGRILAITSVGVKQPLVNMVHSNTARAGLTAYLKTLSSEVVSSGITVNSILPGLHLTDRVHELMGDNIDAVLKSLPTGKAGSVEDFGQIAAFLCSRWTAYLSGVALPVCGGATTGLT